MPDTQDIYPSMPGLVVSIFYCSVCLSIEFCICKHKLALLSSHLWCCINAVIYWTFRLLERLVESQIAYQNLLKFSLDSFRQNMGYLR